MREDPRVAGLEPEDEDAVKGDRQRAEDASRPDQRWIRFTRGGGTGTMPVSFPKMRAPGSTWTIANAPAAVANQALKAIGVEKTLVTRSV